MPQDQVGMMVRSMKILVRIQEASCVTRLGLAEKRKVGMSERVMLSGMLLSSRIQFPTIMAVSPAMTPM